MKKMRGKKGFLRILPFFELFNNSKKINRFSRLDRPKFLLDPPKKKTNYAHILIFSSILLAILLSSFFIFSSSSTACDSYSCFIGAVENCDNANMIADVNGNVYEFSTSSCKVTKKITLVSDSEPAEIVNLIEGKSMVCDFILGPPDEVFIYDMFSSLDLCTGELKESIYELIIAQYESSVTDLENENDYLLFLLNQSKV